MLIKATHWTLVDKILLVRPVISVSVAKVNFVASQKTKRNNTRYTSYNNNLRVAC